MKYGQYKFQVILFTKCSGVTTLSACDLHNAGDSLFVEVVKCLIFLPVIGALHWPLS